MARHGRITMEKSSIFPQNERDLVGPSFKIVIGYLVLRRPRINDEHAKMVSVQLVLLARSLSNGQQVLNLWEVLSTLLSIAFTSFVASGTIGSPGLPWFMV